MATANQPAISNQSSSIREQIRDFVSENLAGIKGVTSFTDDESLVDIGVIDSLGIFRLVAYLEETFGIRIGDEEIAPENLRSIDLMEQFVVSRLRK